ncbi:branched-chain amino acid transport system permease protein [Rhizobium sp. SG_E_25_P2]|uniref:branched-chain amino acid ABC transporter permease n=1 Tax=Rhizobium sp. SG_E_25_P2 TaxID=2879942 RepID=UPI002475186E|nr:branched-chain amino acid ABC transporter permease [Rhizobium sp. SG_E_25_P2]MDH6266030.1 branched-chain amino acid transport system permease protein [Rhizobium sp. SG_E_25_P2]
MNALIVRAIPFVLFIVFVLSAPFMLGDGSLHLATEMFIVIVIASMWNLLAGYAGLMSLGHQMYFGAGGYVLYLFANATGLHPYTGLFAAFVFGGLAAVVIAPLLFRLRDAYFAITSWVLAEMVSIAVQKTDALGGITGFSLTDMSVIDFAQFETQMFQIGAAMLLVAVLGSLWLLRSKPGLAFMCVRDNERAASAIGIDVWPNRLLAYVLSAAGCAAAGGLSMLGGLVVQPGNAFSPDWTVIMTFVVVVGGIGTLEGPIVGTIVYYLLRQVLTVIIPLSGTWYLVAMGVVAVATMLYAPGGLWPIFRDRLRLDWLTIRRTL